MASQSSQSSGVHRLGEADEAGLVRQGLFDGDRTLARPARIRARGRRRAGRRRGRPGRRGARPSWRRRALVVEKTGARVGVVEWRLVWARSAKPAQQVDARSRPRSPGRSGRPVPGARSSKLAAKAWRTGSSCGGQTPPIHGSVSRQGFQAAPGPSAPSSSGRVVIGSSLSVRLVTPPPRLPCPQPRPAPRAATEGRSGRRSSGR